MLKYKMVFTSELLLSKLVLEPLKTFICPRSRLGVCICDTG